MFSTYCEKDVTILLKDISGMVTPLGTKDRERLIQSGTHYSQMLPLEYEPSPEYMAAYEQALQLYSGITADAVAVAAEKIWAEKGPDVVLVSLARAGTSIGVLIKRYLRLKYAAEPAHYTISIIRGRGIDHNAMRFILARHKPEHIQFVDGWTGKGAIQRELNAAMGAYPGVSPGLAVLSDPARVAEKCGTHDDFLIASSCLNATVSGLLSRTFLRSDIIGPGDYHGAAFYRELQAKDLTYQFIRAVEKNFRFDLEPGAGPSGKDEHTGRNGLDEVYEIGQHFGVSDINLIKPGIGEATRVLLRRMPWKLLVYRLDDDLHLGHLYQLAREKGAAVVEYPLRCYKACGLIRSIADT